MKLNAKDKANLEEGIEAIAESQARLMALICDLGYDPRISQVAMNVMGIGFALQRSLKSGYSKQGLKTRLKCLYLTFIRDPVEDSPIQVIANMVVEKMNLSALAYAADDYKTIKAEVD